MAFYFYDRESQVHVVDCSGPVSLELGTERVRLLKAQLAETTPRGGLTRLLIDFRNTIWADEQVHRELSRITRTELGLTPDNAEIRVAFVVEGHSGRVAENEAWFSEPRSAMDWLSRR